MVHRQPWLFFVWVIKICTNNTITILYLFDQIRCRYNFMQVKATLVEASKYSRVMIMEPQDKPRPQVVKLDKALKLVRYLSWKKDRIKYDKFYHCGVILLVEERQLKMGPKSSSLMNILIIYLFIWMVTWLKHATSWLWHWAPSSCVMILVHNVVSSCSWLKFKLCILNLLFP